MRALIEEEWEMEDTSRKRLSCLEISSPGRMNSFNKYGL